MRICVSEHSEDIVSFQVLLEVFLAGIGLGLGPCFLFCLPIIVPYILGKSSTVREGLRLTVIFSLGRIFSYSILGFTAVYLINTANIQILLFKKIAGIFIILTGITYLFSRREYKICGILNGWFVKKSQYNIFIIGILIGLSPCAPLIGVLTYILCKSSIPIVGFGYGLSFGIGTSLSPILIAGLAAGGLSGIISKRRNLLFLTKIITGIALVYFGVKLIL
ncbi:MAG: sulfite exporter TauE/SafE family protein [Elusimicrobia bacterium]|nr:sulfite exporter TauE/SafE family protein [Elusimicrobiota bacterium]